MKRSYFKKALSVFFAMLMLASILPSGTTAAYADEVIYYNSDTLDYSEYGYFYASHPGYYHIAMNANCSVYFSIVDEDDDDVVYKSDISSYNETLWLYAGEYEFEIEDYDYYDYYDDEDEPSYSKRYEIVVTDVTKLSTGIKFKKSSITMAVNEMAYPDYTLSPAGSIEKNTRWTSSNKKVAEVSRYGAIYAVGLGKCTVTAKLHNGKAAKITVKVTSKDVYVFKNSTRNLPKINGSKMSWRASNSNAGVSGQTVKGKRQGKCVISTKKDKVTYKINLYVVDYNSLLSSTKSKLRDTLKNPDSLKVYHIWRGYDSDGNPTVVLDYGATNSYGAMVRGDSYCVGYSYYDQRAKKIKTNTYYPSYMPTLTAKKKVK